MTVFGRRLAPPAGAPSLDMRQKIALAKPASRKPFRLPLWAHLVLLSAGASTMALSLFETPPNVRDGAPGRQFMAPGFAIPPGCPARRWASGEYMPRACAGRASRLPQPEAYGLPTSYRTGRHYRSVTWIRSGPDAAMVRCALTNCRVWAVARYRFRSPPGGLDGVYDPDARDYRIKPLDYLLTESAAVSIMPILAGALGLLMLFGKRQRRP